MIDLRKRLQKLNISLESSNRCRLSQNYWYLQTHRWTCVTFTLGVQQIKNKRATSNWMYTNFCCKILWMYQLTDFCQSSALNFTGAFCFPLLGSSSSSSCLHSSSPPPPSPVRLSALAKGVRRFQLTEHKPCSPPPHPPPPLPPLSKKHPVFFSSRCCHKAKNSGTEEKNRVVIRGETLWQPEFVEIKYELLFFHNFFFLCYEFLKWNS